MNNKQQNTILVPAQSKSYQLLDSGNGMKVERFGDNIIVRPDANCVWSPQAQKSVWANVDAILEKTSDGKYTWEKKKSFKDLWTFTFDGRDQAIVFSLRLSSASKNLGIFPEQASNWQWMMNQIYTAGSGSKPSVLNLFGYTGGATLCAAAAGAKVCHVDASQAAVTWARANQTMSLLGGEPVRWIVDDCVDFVSREIKRGVSYDAIILDPPAFGRDQKGKVFEFEKQVQRLLGLCKQVLVPDPLFVIFNGYSMGYSATVLKNLLGDFFPGKNIEFGELHLQEKSGQRTLPCSLYARFGRE
ncbi:MAG: class I SAM-dependent methyltransferase [bacterium]